jgi:hypothetical protein
VFETLIFLAGALVGFLVSLAWRCGDQPDEGT